MTNSTDKLTEGQKVTTSGYNGTITKVCDGQLTGMYEVRLERGLICICGSDIVPVNGSDELILSWLRDDRSTENVERVARYMSRTLRIGGMKSCREMIQAVIAN